MFKEYTQLLSVYKELNPAKPVYRDMTVSEFVRRTPDISNRLRSALMKYPDVLIKDITHRLYNGIGPKLMEEIEDHLRRLEWKLIKYLSKH